MYHTSYNTWHSHPYNHPVKSLLPKHIFLFAFLRGNWCFVYILYNKKLLLPCVECQRYGMVCFCMLLCILLKISMAWLYKTIIIQWLTGSVHLLIDQWSCFLRQTRGTTGIILNPILRRQFIFVVTTIHKETIVRLWYMIF